jgi:hypothetical protein
VQNDVETHEIDWRLCPGSTDRGDDHPPAATAALLHTNPKAARIKIEEASARRALRFDRGRGEGTAAS